MMFHPTKTSWRAEARAGADELVMLSSPEEAYIRFPEQHGILAEIHLRNRGWYSFTMTGRCGNQVRIFAELRYGK